jgi:hypothetical protein
MVIHSLECALSGAGTIVACPTSDARVQGCDEGGLVAPTVSMDKHFHLFQMTLLGFFAWFDDDLVSTPTVMLSHWELSDGKAQKIESDATFVLMKRVGNVRLAGFQAQPDISQPGFGHVSSRLKRIQVFAENDKVSGPREFHPRALSEPDVNLSAHPAPIIQPKAEFPAASAQTVQVYSSPVAPSNGWL